MPTGAPVAVPLVPRDTGFHSPPTGVDPAGWWYRSNRVPGSNFTIIQFTTPVPATVSSH